MLFSERIGVKIAELPGWQCGETGPRPAQPHWAQANVKVVLLIPATCHVAELPPDTLTLVHYSLDISPLEAYLSAVVWISILTVSARLSPGYFARYSGYPRDQSPLSSPDPEHCQYRESGVWELFPATKHHNITHLPSQQSPHLPFIKILFYIIVFHCRYDQAGTAWPWRRW